MRGRWGVRGAAGLRIQSDASSGGVSSRDGSPRDEVWMVVKYPPVVAGVVYSTFRIVISTRCAERVLPICIR